MIRTTVRGILIVALISCGVAPLVYFVRVQYGAAQEGLIPHSGNYLESPHPEISRYVENLAFGVGERLHFDIGYGFINAGSATMEVVELIEYDGRPAYRIVSTAQSNKFFSSFYPVRDRVESITDAIGLFSWYFDKKLCEGKYRSHRMYGFDQISHEVVYKGDTMEIAPYVQDALSMLYYVRTQPLEVGKSIFVDNFTDGRRNPVEVKVHRNEQIRTKAGDFNCLVVEPLLRTAGVFKHEGKLTVWLTDDRLRLPVMMKSKVVVGSITAELTDYRLGQLEEF
jgi:hypothetical protein